MIAIPIMIAIPGQTRSAGTRLTGKVEPRQGGNLAKVGRGRRVGIAGHAGHRRVTGCAGELLHGGD
ncbi:MAG: hypothetical protein ACRDSN_13950, partial [Pseudonocardiaceae bacterium]